MISNLYRRRSSFRPSVALLAMALLLALALPARAVDLRAYNATYRLYKGGMHVGNSSIELARNGDYWHWRMGVRARGFYSLFTRKQPLVETLFAPGEDSIRLHRITVSDAGNGKSSESASFDWSNGEVEVHRKGKRRTLPLEGGVYDQQTLHWLAATMLEREQKSLSVTLYRKGKLVDSILSYRGRGIVAIDGEEHDSHIFTQWTQRSSSRLRLYYDVDNPMLPLRVERQESGDTPAILQLESVDWQL
ncbi:MAG: DUF3108 domain-containing protein [Gammaproteobacteria bacterium]|nr:DUF3108 domain-containing protein [Gammaproteobacteria bacterium]